MSKSGNHGLRRGSESPAESAQFIFNVFDEYSYERMDLIREFLSDLQSEFGEEHTKKVLEIVMRNLPHINLEPPE